MTYHDENSDHDVAARLGYDSVEQYRAARGSDGETYKVVRFFADDTPSETVKTGLTLDEAQAHCKLEWTHGEGWFDGYDKE